MKTRETRSWSRAVDLRPGRLKDKLAGRLNSHRTVSCGFWILIYVILPLEKKESLRLGKVEKWNSINLVQQPIVSPWVVCVEDYDFSPRRNLSQPHTSQDKPTPGYRHFSELQCAEISSAEIVHWKKGGCRELPGEISLCAAQLSLPAFVLVRDDSTESWHSEDAARDMSDLGPDTTV